MICKGVFWVILDIYPLQRFVLIPTWIILVQVYCFIAIMPTMTMSYERTFVSFVCTYSLLLNYAQLLWQPRNIICLIPERNNAPTFTPDRILNNPKSINIKNFVNTLDIYWGCIIFKLHIFPLVGITLVHSSSVKD